MFQTKIVEKIKTHILCSITFFIFENHIVEKYCRVEQATDDNTARAHCMLDTQGYKYALRLCKSYCFSLQQCLHERAPLCIYTYNTVHCLSCFLSRGPCTECKGSGLETRPRHDPYAVTRVPICITLALFNRDSSATY